MSPSTSVASDYIDDLGAVMVVKATLADLLPWQRLGKHTPPESRGSRAPIFIVKHELERAQRHRLVRAHGHASAMRVLCDMIMGVGASAANS